MEVSLLFFYSVILLGVVALAQQQQRLSSREDLLGLYSLRSSLGIQSRFWPRSTDPCSNWTGVNCQLGRVTGLNLTGLARTRLGRSNARFAVDGLQNLTRLVYFSSTGFALPGPIPDWFGSRLAASVSLIDLRRSSITGNIPGSLGNLVGLRALSLTGNLLAGDIPASLGQLGNLTVLDLSSNKLANLIPLMLGRLGNLNVLDLSSNSLAGSIPPQLGTLRNLTSLLLSDNRLTGSVPAAIGRLTLLTTLDLSMNSLSGQLPVELKEMMSLQVMNLGNNLFTGNLPPGIFPGLPRLRSFTLRNNNFSGLLEDSFWELPGLRFADVSNNSFTGVIPDAVVNVNASGAVFNFSSNLYYGNLPSGIGSLLQRLRFLDISSNYFEGVLPFARSTKTSLENNCFSNATAQRSLTDCANFYSDRGLTYDGLGSGLSAGNSGRRNNAQLIYILVGVFGGILLVTLVVFIVLLCVRKRGAIMAVNGSNGVVPGGDMPPIGDTVSLSASGDAYTYDQLLKATSNFSDANFLKHGHSGDLYKGTLEGGAHVVVKKIDVDSFEREVYHVELEFFARYSHTRLIPHFGNCLENENVKFIVYKYMPHADLSTAFFRKSGQELPNGFRKSGQEKEGLQSLDWITRQKIAIGVAEALLYLHQECVPPIVHRDIQASSILLDDKFEVRLGSLSEVCTQEGDCHQSVITRILRSSQSSGNSSSGSKSATCAYDVYCFGKVLLELVTGKLGISASNDISTSGILEEIVPHINISNKESLTNILDPTLIVDEDLMEEVWAMAIVAKACLNPKASKRPLMKHILKALENPLRVVRDEGISGSARLRTTSQGSWNTILLGSWRSSSDIAPLSGTPREVTGLKRSDTTASRDTGEEQSSCVNSSCIDY